MPGPKSSPQGALLIFNSVFRGFRPKTRRCKSNYHPLKERNYSRYVGGGGFLEVWGLRGVVPRRGVEGVVPRRGCPEKGGLRGLVPLNPAIGGSPEKGG